MAISNKETIIGRMAQLGLHGMTRDAWRRFSNSQKKTYDVIEFGYKMNLTDLQSAIGLAQLERLDEMHARRQRLWARYNEELKDLELELPFLPDEDKGDKHALHLYSVGLPEHIDRDEFVWTCSKIHSVILGIHYNAVPGFTAYRNKGYFCKAAEEFPIAMSWGRRTVSLSLSAGVSDDDCTRVISAVRSTYKQLSH